MPDLRCPRCGNKPVLFGTWGDPESPPDRDFYRCPCGPLCVVEGERVTWYAPMEETHRLRDAIAAIEALTLGAPYDAAGNLRAIGSLARAELEVRSDG